MNERIRLTNSFNNSFIRLTIPIRLTISNSFNELSAVLAVFLHGRSEISTRSADPTRARATIRDDSWMFQ